MSKVSFGGQGVQEPILIVSHMPNAGSAESENAFSLMVNEQIDVYVPDSIFDVELRQLTLDVNGNSPEILLQADLDNRSCGPDSLERYQTEVYSVLRLFEEEILIPRTLDCSVCYQEMVQMFLKAVEQKPDSEGLQFERAAFQKILQCLANGIPAESLIQLFHDHKFYRDVRESFTSGVQVLLDAARIYQTQTQVTSS